MSTSFDLAGELDRLGADRDRLVTELRDINDRIEAGDGSAGLKERGDNLLRGITNADSEIAAKRASFTDEVMASWSANPAMGEAGSEPDSTGPRPRQGTDGAKRVIDQAVKSGRLPDHAGARTEKLLAECGPLAARWVTTTGDPAYLTAFMKMVADPARGHLLWDSREGEAYRKVAALDAEMKDMQVGVGAQGGFQVPFTLDPAIMLTSDGSINPLRQVARVVQTATDSWNGVTSAGVTAEWLAESAEAADASPTLAQPPIPVHKGSAFVPFSYEYGDDVPTSSAELGRLLTDAADQLQAEAFMNGTGAGQPTGLTVGLDAGSQVATAAADTLAAADVFGLQNVLPPRFQARAQFLSNLATANEIQQFETAAGAKVFPEISTGSLLRKNWNEASHLDAAGDTATAGNDNVLAYGDFMAGFVIVDRIGTRVELIQNLFGANQRPTGQRGLFMWFRTGSDVVVDNAIRVLTA